ncbi:hypothetical protein [Marmoricola sp. RAF53]|uniref:hypothetical protein n=1 Tax=Marmoricola sp. RAF53 TaxID=3233059 RepID=UPI003F992F1E
MSSNAKQVAISASVLAALAALAAVSGCGGSGPTTSSPSAGQTTSGQTVSPSAPSTQAGASKPAPAHATEFNPPGDIPDNQVFVDYRPPGSTVHIKVPEGWPRSTTHGVTTFTDHYNSIAIQTVPMATAPTPASARRSEVPSLRSSVSKFTLQQVSAIKRQHGPAVLVTYLLDSAPNQVSGKVVRDAAERYEFWHAGQEAVLTLTGPKGADNVDPWRLVSDSLHWS